MNNGKKVLLIGGLGTLGSYTMLNLLSLGYSVDAIAREDYTPLDRKVRVFNVNAMDDAELIKLFSENRYCAIVDFMHYTDPEFYKQRSKLLLDNTDQLIFLSSYRVYADNKGVIDENGAQLLNTVTDEYFLANENYAIPKSKNEITLRKSGRKNWTIIRPLISFSHFRLDLCMLDASILLSRSKANKPILMPENSRLLTAGVGWAGNVGKMIARLIGKDGALGEDFTVGYCEKFNWETAAEYYTDLLGSKFVWGTNEQVLKSLVGGYGAECRFLYDRLYNRNMDISKVLRVTGLTTAELVPMYDALIYELHILSEHSELQKRFDNDFCVEANRRMDAALGL